MKSKVFIIGAVLVVVLVNCTAMKTDEHDSPQPPITVIAPTMEVQSFDSNESLAEAMMKVFPVESSVDYRIVGDKFFPSGEVTFEFLEITSDSIATLTTSGWEDTTSPNGIFRAFVACEDEQCQDRLFVEDLTNSQIFEVTFSARLPWRPISSVMWIDDYVLAFSQWSNPHYGFRYAIDINQKQPLLTLVTADECIFSGDC
jgi:hypothetical protein